VDDVDIKPYQVASAVPLLRAIGFEIGLDWDNSLVVKSPPAVDCELIEKLLRRADPDVLVEVLWEEARAKKKS
jgi:hypothetical protein